MIPGKSLIHVREKPSFRTMATSSCTVDAFSLLWIIFVATLAVPLTRRDFCMVGSFTTTPSLWHKPGKIFNYRRPPFSSVSPPCLYINHDNVQGEAKDDDTSLSTISYEDTDGATKGIVLGLTNLVNAASDKSRKFKERDNNDVVSPNETQGVSTATATLQRPPTSTQELLERIQSDYTKRNYLWTGKLDLACFAQNCTFADPTLKFTGIDTFQTNTQNLVPLVEAFVGECESKLLSIELVEEQEHTSGIENLSYRCYIQTRWNMVGSLTASPWLFWKPKIDVIGRTKFWFRPTAAKREQQPFSDHSCFYQVYSYDEEWEIPAYQALLQLISPSGTFSNSNYIKNSNGAISTKDDMKATEKQGTTGNSEKTYR
jgi:hypothetical protein